MRLCILSFTSSHSLTHSFQSFTCTFDSCLYLCLFCLFVCLSVCLSVYLDSLIICCIPSLTWSISFRSTTKYTTPPEIEIWATYHLSDSVDGISHLSGSPTPLIRGCIHCNRPSPPGLLSPSHSLTNSDHLLKPLKRIHSRDPHLLGLSLSSANETHSGSTARIHQKGREWEK